jgi:hypothetical protein
VLTGAKLNEVNDLLGATVDSTVAKTTNLTILYETGFDLVCLKTDKRGDAPSPLLGRGGASPAPSGRAHPPERREEETCVSATRLNGRPTPLDEKP